MLPDKASHYNLNYCIVMRKSRIQSTCLLGMLPDPSVQAAGKAAAEEKGAPKLGLGLTRLDPLEINQARV